MENSTTPQRAFVVHVDYKRPQFDAQGYTLDYRVRADAAMDEAIQLTRAINLEVTGHHRLNLQRIISPTFLGKGTVEMLKGQIQMANAKLVIMNAQLSPIQQRNLEVAWNVKVLDRHGLILEIFGDRARTAEGKLQVELAALTYQRSRLVRSWTHLERQRGGFGFLGGPGEKQIELDRRMIDTRIMKIKHELDKVVRTRALQRESRHHFPTVVLVGYTNAGKSSLFNVLTGATVLAKDMLFATLDPTIRQWLLAPGLSVLISDTVGFISDLPTELVAAFRATLEEVRTADLILHVRDAASPLHYMQAKEVYHVLRELGLPDPEAADNVVEVYNKVDAIPDGEVQPLLEKIARTPHAVAISALQGTGLDQLKALCAQIILKNFVQVKVHIPYIQARKIDEIYRRFYVTQRHDAKTSIILTALIPQDQLDFFKTRGLAVERC